MIIDTHVHIHSYPEDEIEEILQRASSVGVGLVIDAGTTLDTSLVSVELSSRHDRFFSGVGVHPMDIEDPLSSADCDVLQSMASSNEKVIVMSEIGLDYLESSPDRALQFDAFRRQISIAKELSLPIVFHSREAHEDCFRVLLEEKAYEVPGVMHYFQGTLDDAKRVIDLGFYISIARPIFRLGHLADVVSQISLDHIVVETDSSPQPFKNNRNNWTEPRHLRPIIEKIAELQEKSVNEVEEKVFTNTKKILSKRWDIVEKYISCD